MNSVSGFYFDTVNVITAACDEDTLARCMTLCEHYEKLLSKTIPGSEVWQLNHAEGRRVRVCGDTLRLIEASLDMFRASSGAFNIAVGALMELWSFKSEHPAVPEDSAILAALKSCDAGRIETDGTNVRLPEDMRIDLGGIAKGYIADRVGEYLKYRGVSSALLNFGGNIVAVGPKEDGSAWRVGLQAPGGEWGRDCWAATELRAGTIVTSGVYERYFELNGRRYHHILNPRTGKPVDNGLLSVTMRGADSMTADALATAALVLDGDAGAKLAQLYGFDTVLMYDDGRILKTPGFRLLLDDEMAD